MKFDIKELGHSTGISGVVYTDYRTDTDFVLPLPDECLADTIEVVSPDDFDWSEVLRQTDQMETEILAQSKDGEITKAIVRKCNRQIDQKVSWQVFKRDGYACSYCGNSNTPLTVDHLVLWEQGGPSIPQNLLSSCKKCNKTRGNLLFHDWIRSTYYLKVCQNPMTREQHERIASTLNSVPLKYDVVSR